MRKDQAAQHKALRISEEAAKWLYELRSDGPKQYEAYLDWLLESPQHVEAFLQVSAVDASLSKVDPERSIQIVRPMSTTDVDNVVPLAQSATSARSTAGTRAAITNKRNSSHRLPWAVAASIAVIGVLAVGVWT